MEQLQTDRLILRRWRETDLPLFAELNADPEVMRYFPKVLSREESDSRVVLIEEHFKQHGFAQWAVEVRGGASFIGFTGLSIPAFSAHFTPCVEVGWRLCRAAWGNGYATEAARVAIQAAFDEFKLNSIVSFTVPANQRSRRVMERLGMTHNPDDDFDHPLLPESHPLCRHVLYRLERAHFLRMTHG